MGRPAVQQVAPPFQSLTISGELQTGEILDRPRGPVFARNPLRGVERERAWARRDLELSVKDFSRRFAGIDRKADCRRMRLRPRGT